MTGFDKFRSEHAELRPHVEALLVAADAVDLPSARALFELVDESWRFLTEHLLPHAKAEEHSLYRAFTQIVGAPEAARLLFLDHETIGALVDELGELRRKLADHDTIGGELAHDLRRVLYGLHAMVDAHFVKEEDVIVPFLEERLSPTDSERLFDAMRRHELAHN